MSETVLDCYRLGKFFGVDPCVFLRKSFSEIDRHIYWMNTLNERLRIASSIED